MVSIQPNFGQVPKHMVVRDLLRRQVAVIVKNRLLARHLVIQPLRGIAIQKEVLNARNFIALCPRINHQLEHTLVPRLRRSNPLKPPRNLAQLHFVNHSFTRNRPFSNQLKAIG